MALRSRRSRGAQLAVVAALVATGFAGAKGRLARFEVAESSMEPALRPGDYLVAVATAAVRRGEIVVYPDPATPGRDLIKRAIGLGGETVSIAAGQVAVDGVVLAEAWADGPAPRDGEWVIPPGSIFTLGDNRRSSSGDSLSTGPVALSGVHRAVWRYWPPGSFGRL